MRIKLLLLMTALTLSSALYAERVPESRARTVAGSFFDHSGAAPVSAHGISDAASELELVWTGGDDIMTKSDDSAPAFYVYVRHGGGFVIVAGDDSVTPVLGYSMDGVFTTEDMPDNVSWWFAQLRDFIRAGVSQGLEATDRTKAEWAGMGKTAEVVVYIPTPAWDQGYPYNVLCPEDGTARSYTGCVATAMAEVLRAITYPSEGTGTIPAYVTDSKRISVPEHTLGDRYCWNSMPMEYSSAWTDTEIEQVSGLMYDCGTSVQMDYTKNGSGAYSEDVAGALKTYFKIDEGARYEMARYNPDWEQMLKDQLDTGYPLYYSAVTKNLSAGHAFVLDGYDSEGRFHINFGWSGQADGYMAYPEFKGGSYRFTAYHDAVFGIKPSGEEPGWMSFKAVSDSDRGLVSSVCDYVIGEEFTITADGILYNAGYGSFSGEVAVARVSSSGDFQEIISSSKMYSGAAPGSGDTDLTFSCTLTGLDDGDRAELFSMSEGESSWTKIECTGDAGFCSSVCLEQRIDLPSHTSLSFDSRSRVLSVSTPAEATFSMEGPTGSVQYEKSGGDVTVGTADLPAGSYTITIGYRTQSYTLTVKL